MQRNRPFQGQPHTYIGIRGATPISGVNLRDLRDCFIRGYVLSHSNDIDSNKGPIDQALKGVDAILCEDNLYQLSGDIDPMAVCINMLNELERIMKDTNDLRSSI